MKSAKLPRQVAPQRVPFNSPFVTGREIDYIQQAIQAKHLSGGGLFTGKCQALLKESLDASEVLLTTSCTHALEMAALLLDIRPGDEFIVPSFTFVSTANAFALRGAKPVFIDIRPDTLNLNEALLEGLISPKTKAILVMHYAGVACEMEAILKTARGKGIAVVEDNAHGLYGYYKGAPLGTFGSMACLSFHDTKNFTCGEGGALVINQPSLCARAEIIRDKGTDRSRYFRGEVDKYTWIDTGSSYAPSEILAAYLFAQLECSQEIQRRRRRIWHRYEEELQGWAAARGVSLPTVPQECSQAYHMFYLLLPDEGQRDAFIDHLNGLGVYGFFHYVPLHSSAMGRRFGGGKIRCPVTESVSGRLVRLPFFSGLTEEEQGRIVAAIEAF